MSTWGGTGSSRELNADNRFDLPHPLVPVIREEIICHYATSLVNIGLMLFNVDHKPINPYRLPQFNSTDVSTSSSAPWKVKDS